MSKKPKRSSPATLPAAKLKLLAEHMVEQMNSGTIALPDLSSFEFTWYDLDQYRIQWQEYLNDPEGYDFFAWLDEIGQKKGWTAKRVAALKKSARPTDDELLACVPMSGDEGYDFFRTAMVQEVLQDGKPVGLALIDIGGGGQGGPELFLLGAFSTRERLDAYARKNRMTE
jgi:hypothetical protein